MKGIPTTKGEHMIRQPQSSYLICATPRSGSTLLCEALTNTGIAGRPEEYFETLQATGLPRRPFEYFADSQLLDVIEHLGGSVCTDIPIVPQASSSSYADYLAAVLKEGTTPNGVFGAKVMWGYLADFVSNLHSIPAYRALDTPTLLATIFPGLHYIRVIRRDKVRQAISLWKAIQTQTWREDSDEATDNVPTEGKQLLFHFDAIEHLIQQIQQQEQAWQHYFEQIGMQPLVIVYEEWIAAYEETAHTILDYLNIPIPDGLIFAPRKMKRQADTISEEWVRQYYEHRQ